MRTLPVHLCKLLGLVFLALLSGGALADGAKLFNSADMLARTREATTLSAAEAAHLGKLRAGRNVANAIVLSINRAALDTSVLTLVTPEGRQHQYVGSKAFGGEPNSFTWAGTSSTGYCVIAYSDKGLSGSFHEDGKTFSLGTLEGGRFNIMFEDTIAPSTVDDTP